MNDKFKKGLIDILYGLWDFLIVMSLISIITFAFWKIDIVTRQVLWYLSCAIWISSCFNKKHMNDRLTIIDKYNNLLNATFVIVILIVFGGVFLIKTYDTSFNWYWYAFVIVAVFTLCGTGCCAIIGWERSDKSANIKKRIITLSAKMLSYLWLADLFYMSFIVGSLLLRFIFGIIVLAIILSSLAVAFLSNTQSSKWLLLIDFLYGIGLTIYLIYIIPEKYTNLQTIVFTIVAAVYGGLLTLVGVAWTIRKGNKDRNEDLERRDKERREDLERIDKERREDLERRDKERREDLERIDKERREDLERIDKERAEDERKKYKPFFITSVKKREGNYSTIDYQFIENESFSFSINEKCTTQHLIRQWVIINTNLNMFAVYGFKFNNSIVKIHPFMFVDLNEIINVKIPPFFFIEEINRISILVIDMLDNVYEVILGFDSEKQGSENILIIKGITRPKLTDINVEL